MLEQKTIVDQIEITSGNQVQIRLALLVLNNDKELSRKYHRTQIPLDLENGAELQMNEVNDHLEMMGEKTVTAADVARIAAYVGLTKSLGA